MGVNVNMIFSIVIYTIIPFVQLQFCSFPNISCIQLTDLSNKIPNYRLVKLQASDGILLEINVAVAMHACTCTLYSRTIKKILRNFAAIINEDVVLLASVSSAIRKKSLATIMLIFWSSFRVAGLNSAGAYLKLNSLLSIIYEAVAKEVAKN